MARFRHFAFSLFSGYGALGANVIYTLASIPLALSFLSKEEFGLWGVILQIMVGIQLMEAGMTGAAARLLIDRKDRQKEFGMMVKTVTLLFFAQALIILAIGLSLARPLSHFLNVPAHLESEFIGLLRWYCGVFAFSYALRVFNQALFAFHRNDIVNYAQIVAFGLQLVLLWVGFAAGFGLWSVLLAYAGGVLWQLAVCATASFYLKFISLDTFRQSFNRRMFWEVFHYSKDRLLVIVGQKIILAAPSLIITKFLGLEATAAWTVGTRLFMLCQQVLFRFHDFAYPALAEMFVRNERQNFCHRFRSLTILSMALGAVAAVMIGSLNTWFMHLWTGAKLQWTWHLDIVLALWLLISLSVRSNWIAISISKHVGGMRFIYFFEAIFLVAAGGLAVKHFGSMVFMPILILAAALVFTFPYAIWRTSKLVNLPIIEVGGKWFLPMASVLVPLAAVAVAVRQLVAAMSPVAAFGTSAVVLAICGAVLLWLQSEIRAPLYEAFGRVFRRIKQKAASQEHSAETAAKGGTKR